MHLYLSYAQLVYSCGEDAQLIKALYWSDWTDLHYVLNNCL